MHQEVKKSEEFALNPLPLTPREKSVAELLIEGLEQHEIAQRLNFAPSYIYELMRQIRDKYCANNTYHLIVLLAKERYACN